MKTPWYHHLQPSSQKGLQMCRKKFIIFALLMFLFSQENMANPGRFFKINAHGSVFSIKTVVPNHLYPQASLKVISRNAYFSKANCDQVLNNRCLFRVSNTQAKQIVITGKNGPIELELCLNGVEPVTCQRYFSTLINNTATVGSVTINNILNPLTYFSDNLGLTWSDSILPTFPTGATSVKLGAVSCNSRLCVTGGYTDSAALFYISTNGGRSWGNPITVNGPVGNTKVEINSLNCSATGRCVAVGLVEFPGVVNGLSMISTNNGVTWTLSSNQPLPPDNNSTQLWGVSCSQDGLICIATGWAVINGEDAPVTYTSLNGGNSWLPAVLPTLPTAQGYQSGVLFSVACSSTGKQCVSAGYAQTDASSPAAVPVSYQTTDAGITWKSAVLPNVPLNSLNSEIKGVSCDSQGLQCVAAGATIYSSGVNANLIYTSTNGGATWGSPILLNGPSNSDSNKLNTVFCYSIGQICIAIGHGSNASGGFIPYSYTSIDGGSTWSEPSLMSVVSNTTDSDLFGASGG
ncbi:BNR/Asp-box repeat containing protein [Legionella gratiana]|uniref:BNR/Asp-box repeat containing protein n=1 Tax=Legionella gratiana TaxID=45066 RepID=A0A378J741_9GAMM|nr:sialidase family protein [Legionella gratiana]KTD10653.1 BNR/Asp-box repeat containing protein [Legionella gratiana]STX43624.1 BNR/Asp-box repeat containing protein [Legionella gratiana]